MHGYIPDLDDPTTDPGEVARAAATRIAQLTGIAHHDVALVLGSGWGGAADALGEQVAEVPAEKIPGFLPPAVDGHGGLITSIRYESAEQGAVRHALVLGARTHLYEGHGVRRVAHGVRTAAATGARAMILTNGCGGLDPAWAPGTPVLIRDHINLTATSPLEGATFVDLTDLYSPRIRALAREIEPGLPEGVYAQFPGPHYETLAEVRMAGVLGADLVGMSTTLEAIAARAAGMEVAGLSLVTNAAAGVSEGALSHEDVLAAGQAAAPRLAQLLATLVRAL